MRKCALLLALCLAVLLTACGSPAPDVTGRYLCTAPADDPKIGEAELWLQLDSGGAGILCMEGEQTLRWTLAGEALTLTLDGETLTGTLKGGLVTLCLADTDYEFTRADLLPAEVSAADLLPAEIVQNALKEDTELQRRYNGNWYGWWELHGATGGYAELEGLRLDLCARVELDADSGGTVTLWDEQHAPDAPLGLVQLSIEPGKNLGEGTATSRSGYFAGTDLEYGDWVIQPDAYPYEELLVIEGASTSEDGSFNYSIFIRPWGRLWSDIEAVESEQLPFHYFDWYLPALEAGAAMPTAVGGEWVAGSQGATNDPSGRTATATMAAGHALFAYSTSQYRAEGGILTALDSGVRIEGSWCGEETATREKTLLLNDRADKPQFTELELRVNGHSARKCFWHDEENGEYVLEYLIDAGGAEQGAALYLHITLQSETDRSRAESVVSTLQLR